MIEKITIASYINELPDIPIIDVRSPGEYLKGHIPKAHNIALFSDEERAKVGTVYKQQSKEKAIALGYEFVFPKLTYFINEAEKVAPNKVIAVHCWRGGMRSQAFAEHLSKNGFAKVYLIEKGYKAYRKLVLSYFENDFNLRILGGYTGSGKTDILNYLKQMGEPVVDLEDLANHQGSAFGGIGKEEQPSTEYFENMLFDQMRQFASKKYLWIEDESFSIGRVFIPHNLFDQIRAQKVYFLDIPVRERAKYLLGTYGTFKKDELAESILRIEKRIGYDKAKIAIQGLKNNDLALVAELMLFYYDKSYSKGVGMRNQDMVERIPLAKVSAPKNAKILLDYIH